VDTEEQPSAIFAMRATAGELTDDNAVQARKQFLVILAHDGFGPEVMSSSKMREPSTPGAGGLPRPPRFGVTVIGE
jgi:hypothetical protein